VAHYIAGVLDREIMVEIVESLCESASFQPGDHVKTLRGSAQGVIKRILAMAAWSGNRKAPNPN
jgi:transcription elongation factor